MRKLVRILGRFASNPGKLLLALFRCDYASLSDVVSVGPSRVILEQYKSLFFRVKIVHDSDDGVI